MSNNIIKDCKTQDKFQIFPIGIVKKQDKSVTIVVYRKYIDALLSLTEFSHIVVCFWFHKNDSHEKREILQVHPRGDKTNPKTGVFATRSPLRPNLIGISTAKILSIDENIIYIDKIDAFHGSPVIDIKPYIPKTDLISDALVSGWAEK